MTPGILEKRWADGTATRATATPDGWESSDTEFAASLEGAFPFPATEAGTPWVQSFWAAVDGLGAEAMQEPEAEETPDPSGVGNNSPPEALARAFTALLADAYGRLLRVESDKAKRADNRGELRQWATAYYDTAAQKHVAATVQPVVAAFLAATGGQAGDERLGDLATRLAVDHVAVSRGDTLQGATAAKPERAAEQAARHLKFIWEATR